MRTRRPAHTGAPRAIGYVRVSTDDQGRSGLGLAAQRATLHAEADRQGWDLTIREEQPASGKSLHGRPVLADALEALRRGDADVLAVAKLDRLSRNVADFAAMLETASRQRWALVALDLAIDTTSTIGAAMAQVAVTFAELERKRIGERTRDALAVKRAQGVRLGRPSTLPGAVVARIVAERAAGASLPVIARRFEADGVATAQGGARWYPATVRKVLQGQDAAKLASQTA